MRFLTNMSIRGKLLTSFWVVILFLLTSVGVGVVQINHISQNSKAVYQSNVRPLETLEQIKADFAELRRATTTVALRGIQGNPDEIRDACSKAENQYAVLQAAGQNHLNRLLEAGESRQRYETVNALLTRIHTEYWPVIENINAMAAAGDVDKMLEGVRDAVHIANDINTSLNQLFTDKMTQAAENTSEITTIASGAMLALIIVGVLATAVSLTLAFYIGGSFSKRISRLRRASKEIAGGNLNSKLTDKYKDELGDLSRDLMLVSDSIGKVTAGLNGLTEEFRNGIISARVDTDDFQGVYKAIGDGINETFALNITETVMFLNSMNEFADGDFSAEIETLAGEKTIMNEVFDAIKARLQSVVYDISMLANAAARGDLSNRVETGKYKGDWAKMMDSLNRLMTAVATPISESREVLALVADGGFDRRMTGDYQGEFLAIKDSVNEMIANMDSYIGEISDALNALARDNLDQEITREYVGKFSSIKDALNNIIYKFNTVITNISTASEQVAAGARQISESSMSLAQGSSEQASAVEELNASMQLINQSTEQNAESARSADKLSERSKANATKGDEQMRNMLSSSEETLILHYKRFSG